MRSSERRFYNLLTFATASMAFLLFFIFALPAFHNQIYYLSDLGWSHLPFRYFYARALAGGHSFLWDPELYCGFYLQGEGLAGMTHPWHLLIYRFLPLTAAFNVELLSSYPMLFAGTVWMLQRWEIPLPAALYGALMFSMSGFNLVHYMHLNAIAIIAHIPWLIALSDILLRSPDPRRVAAAELGIAGLTGSECLLGYPQYVLFSAMAEIAYIVWQSYRRPSAFRLSAWLASKGIGAMIGMIQILPTWELVRASVREAPSMDFRMTYSLHPLSLTQFWSPFALHGHFHGDAPVDLPYNSASASAAIALFFVPATAEDQRWHSLARALLVFAAAMTMLSLGRYGLVYPWVARLPLIGLFRGPGRHIVLAQLAVSALAAIGFARLISFGRRPVPWRILWPLLIPVVLSLLTAAAVSLIIRRPEVGQLPIMLRRTTYSDYSQLFLGTTLIVVAAMLTAAGARGKRWALFGLIVLLGVDIGVQGWFRIQRFWSIPADRFVDLAPRSIEAYVRPVPTPPGPPPARVSLPSLSWVNLLTMKGYRITGGYVDLDPNRALDIHTLLYLRLAGVQWDVDPKLHAWRRVDHPAPRAHLVSRAVPPPDSASAADAFDFMRAGWTQPPVEIEPGAPGRAMVLIDRPGQIDIATASKTRQLLIVSESFHPGWLGTQDGRPVPVVRADGDFIGCPVDPGQHTIELSFRPWSFRWGLRLTLAGLCLALIRLLRSRKSRDEMMTLE